MLFKKIPDFLKKRKLHLALFVIILLGSFLRVYHFGDWLHFETDQVDDYLITAPAIQDGIEKLKLLGPRAGAEELRIGPAYYYLEYLGGKIFGNTPFGHAIPNLILALLSLPLFFLFMRAYFSRNIAAVLLFLYATSFYLIQYSRFSWNPNVLPFFVLATFYLLLRSIDRTEKKRNFFFVLSLTLLAIISQLHFNGLFIIVPSYIIFLLIKRPHFPLKTWLLGASLLILVYSPIILHEIKYNWSNSKLFIEKISGGSEKKEKNIPEKIVQNLRYNSGEFLLILTGEDRVNTSRPNGYSLGLSCQTCKKDFTWRLSALIFYLVSVLLLLWNLFKEKDTARKDFLIISGLWLFLGSAYFISLTLNKLYMYPRFYLVLAPLAFIFIGLIFEKINFQKKLLNQILILLVTLLLVKMNLTKITASFSQLGNSEKIAVPIETEDVFPNYYRTPLFIHQKVVDYIEQQVPDKNAKIFISSESEYEPTYWILLQAKGYQYFDDLNKQNPSSDGNYFFVEISAKKKKQDTAQFNVVETKDFGVLTVKHLEPKNNTLANPEATRQKMKPLKAVEKMRSWEDLLN